MTFEEIPIRMLQLGVDRPWLCRECDYTPSTLASILAPKGTAKSDKALRRIWEALDREEARQKNPEVAFETQQLVLRPSDAVYAHWNDAALREGKRVTEWATDSLNSMADKKLHLVQEPAQKVAEEEQPYPSEGNGSR